MAEPKKGRVTKVVVVDKEASPLMEATVERQAPKDPFNYGGVTGLAEPPYNPGNLIKLAEQHSTHGAAIEQKSMDIAAGGWEWVKKPTGKEPSEEDKNRLEEWLNGLADPANDESTSDIIMAAWMDVETIGYGGIEIGRDGEGFAKKIWSMPGAGFRIHKHGVKIAQGRTGHRTWFKRWIPNDLERVVVRETGRLSDKRQLAQGEAAGNEVLVLRRPTRRKSFYGVPGYVSAIGWIYLSLAARDDNIHFFNNRREPRWCVVLENIEEDQDLETMLQEAFSTGLDQPHRNIFIPIDGEGKIHFQQLTNDAKDISFDRLQERASAEVLLAHRIPPDRLGSVRVGPLGGNATMAASRVYKEGTVKTSQDLLANRINRFIESEAPPGLRETGWEWRPRELDLTEETEDATTVSSLFVNNIYRLDEARQKLKLPKVEGDLGNKFFFELTAGTPAAGASAASAAASAGARVGASLGALVSASKRASLEKSDDPRAILEVVDAHIREVIEEQDDEESGGPRSASYGGS